jgi:hypothetical protein
VITSKGFGEAEVKKKYNVIGVTVSKNIGM